MPLNATSPSLRDRVAAWDPLWVLIGVNLAVFVAVHLFAGTLLGDLVALNVVFDPSALLSRPWTLLTSAFGHFDANHLLFNMFGLWVFGRAVLQAYGPRHLVALYLAGGIVASMFHMVLSVSPMLGASGAVLALSVVFALTYPHRKLLLWFVLPIPAYLAVGAFVVLDVLGLVGPGDGIAHAAHLGGAALGAAYWAWALRSQRGGGVGWPGGGRRAGRGPRRRSRR